MKLKLLLLSVATVSATLTVTAKDEKDNANAPNEIKDSVAYSLGLQIAENLKKNQLITEIDITEMYKAMEDVKNDRMMLTPEKADNIIRIFFTERHERVKAEADKKNSEFFEKNKIVQGVVSLPSGLQYKLERQGEKRPVETDEVEVNYKGMLLDGTVFDSSYDRGESVTFPLNRVIPGWTQGLQHVGEGGKIVLYIPPQLGYGENGAPGSLIGPNATLIFEIELIKIKEPLPKFDIQPLGQ